VSTLPEKWISESGPFLLETFSTANSVLTSSTIFQVLVTQRINREETAAPLALISYIAQTQRCLLNEQVAWLSRWLLTQPHLAQSIEPGHEYNYFQSICIITGISLRGIKINKQSIFCFYDLLINSSVVILDIIYWQETFWDFRSWTCTTFMEPRFIIL